MKFDSVKGKIFKQTELASWQESNYIAFLRFCELFIDIYKGKPRISVTKERWMKAETFLDMPDHPFQEYLYRINIFSWDADVVPKQFYYKFIRIMRDVLTYLKKNPSLISEQMKKIIEPNARFNWCLKQTKIIETPIGEIIVMDKEERTTETPKEVKGLTSYQQQLAEAMIRTTNLLDRLVGSIKDSDIRKLKTTQKLSAIGRLGFVFTVGNKIHVGKQVFNQINIASAGRDELEKSLLEFTKDE